MLENRTKSDMRKAAMLRSPRPEAEQERVNGFVMALGILLVIGSLLLLCVFAFVNGE